MRGSTAGKCTRAHAAPHALVAASVAVPLGVVALRGLVVGRRLGRRGCLVLACWHGYSQSASAALTDTPVGTIKSRVRLGMQKLRVLLVARDQAGALNR